MKIINNIEKMYEALQGNPVRTQERHQGGKIQFSCPVCEKPYITEKGCKNHMEKHDCIDFRALFKGSTTELDGYGIFQKLKAEFTPKSIVTFSSFSKSTSYNSILKYITILRHYGVYHLSDEYMSFVDYKYSPKTINGMLKILTSLATLDEFKIAMHAYDTIEGKTFIEREIVNMQEDHNYFVRCLERCKFGLTDVARDQRLSDIADSLSDYPEYEERFFDLVHRVDTFLKQK